MTRKIQFFSLLVLLLLVLGTGSFLSHLNAQQGTSAPAQAAQPGQQQTPQPGQSYPGPQPGQPQQPGQPTQQPGQGEPPMQQQAPGSQAGQMQGVQTFTGTIVKSGDKYVLQDEATSTTYDIDHQDEVAKHVGQRVRVNGTLDPSGKMIRIQPAGR